MVSWELDYGLDLDWFSLRLMTLRISRSDLTASGASWFGMKRICCANIKCRQWQAVISVPLDSENLLSLLCLDWWLCFLYYYLVSVSGVSLITISHNSYTTCLSYFSWLPLPVFYSTISLGLRLQVWVWCLDYD